MRAAAALEPARPGAHHTSAASVLRLAIAHAVLAPGPALAVGQDPLCPPVIYRPYDGGHTLSVKSRLFLPTDRLSASGA
jgi:hypothetical protein